MQAIDVEPVAPRSSRNCHAGRSFAHRLEATGFAMAVLAALTASAATVHAQPQPANPEGAGVQWTGARRPVVEARRHMVVAANPYAANAGLEILRAGGSAVDAAIAVQLVLGLVEPQSSGLGGGAFLLAWDQTGRALKTYDGRETAPAAARPERFLRNGRPMPFHEAVRSGLAVGVPGTVRLLEHRTSAARAAGRGPRLFEPAIDLADNGFLVSPRLAALLAGEGPGRFDTAARAVLLRSGWPGLAGGASAPERSLCGNPDPDRGRGRQRLLRGPRRRGDRRGGDRRTRASRRHDARRHRRISRQGARACLRRATVATKCAAWVHRHLADWPLDNRWRCLRVSISAGGRARPWRQVACIWQPRRLKLAFADRNWLPRRCRFCAGVQRATRSRLYR